MPRRESTHRSLRYRYSRARLQGVQDVSLGSRHDVTNTGTKLTPTANALLSGASRHSRWDFEGSLLLRDTLLLHREDGEVVHGDCMPKARSVSQPRRCNGGMLTLLDIIDVGDGESASRQSTEVNVTRTGITRVVGAYKVAEDGQLRVRLSP